MSTDAPLICPACGADYAEATDGEGRTVEPAPAAKRRPMMRIGQEFTSENGCLYRVTDVGARTWLAVCVTEALEEHSDDASWLEGPPYAVVEHVFDETDYALLEGVEGIEWEPA